MFRDARVECVRHQRRGPLKQSKARSGDNQMEIAGFGADGAVALQSQEPRRSVHLETHTTAVAAPGVMHVHVRRLTRHSTRTTRWDGRRDRPPESASRPAPTRLRYESVHLLMSILRPE